MLKSIALKLTKLKFEFASMVFDVRFLAAGSLREKSPNRIKQKIDAISRMSEQRVQPGT